MARSPTDQECEASSEADSESSGVKSPSRRDLLKASGATMATGAMGMLAGCGGDGGDGGDGDGSDGGDGDGSDGGGSETIQIDLWRWPHTTQASEDAEQGIVEEFNNLDNGVQVKDNTTPLSDYQTKLKTAIGSDSAPAVFWGDVPWVYDSSGKSREEIANNAPFEYLDEWISEDLLSQFPEALWNRERVNHKGMFGIPFVSWLSPGVIFANLDIWNKTDLGEPPTAEDGWSIQEFNEAMEALTGTEFNGSEAYGWSIGLKDVQRGTWEKVNEWARTYGKVIGDGFQNSDDEWVATWADEAAVKGHETFHVNPVEQGWSQEPLAYTYHETLQNFYSGTDAMTHQETWARAGVHDNSDFDWTALPFPTENNEDYWVNDIGQGSQLLSKEAVGGNPEAGAKYMEFRNNAENNYKFFNESGQGVANQEAYQMMKDEGISDYAEAVDGMSVMTLMQQTFDRLGSVAQAQIDRYPSIKSQEIQGTQTVNQGMPRAVSGGKPNNIIGTEIQRTFNGKDTQEAFVDTEERWLGAIEEVEQSINSDSIGYNSPEPTYGPI